MKTNRLLKHRISHLKPLFLFLGFGILVITIWKIPPSSPILVFGVIGLVTAIVTVITSLFKRPKLTIMVASFATLFLSMTYLVGFDIMNTILLISFIIALSQLIPIKKVNP